MKQNTTEIQTVKLVELRFEKPRYVTMFWRDNKEVTEINYILGELLSFLPENVAKENETPLTLNISLMNGEWCVQYADFLRADFEFCNTELIDALYDMCVKLKEEGVI